MARSALVQAIREIAQKTKEEELPKIDTLIHDINCQVKDVISLQKKEDNMKLYNTFERRKSTIEDQ